MNGTEYLRQILTRETVDTRDDSPVRRVLLTLGPLLHEWGQHLCLDVQPSGSFRKGTAILSGTDIDLLVLMSEKCSDTLKVLYGKVYGLLQKAGYQPARQDVSIHIPFGGYSVDLIPAKRQNSLTSDHSIYLRRTDRWTKTNLARHIDFVVAAGWQQEIRLAKLWRNQHQLDFPSFYLELAVIHALERADPHSTCLDSRLQTVFAYLRDSLLNTQMLDPANTANVVSDDLTPSEKHRICRAASAAYSAAAWSDVVL